MEWITEILNQRKKENSYRELITSGRSDCVNFSSNDYLSLANHPLLIKKSMEFVEKYGTSSSSSRLMSGNPEIFDILEREIAKLKGKPTALVFNTGYQANIGIICSVCGSGDVIFSDRLNHASIIDGILLSGARFFRFKHNDSDDLESHLKKERKKYRKALIVTETIFSMEGDKPDLRKIVELKEKYNAMLMVDEAHSTGIFGETGSGVVEETGMTERIDLIMGTFGKALGSFGAYLATSNELRNYLINTCRSFIYSTALPPSVIGANLAAIEVVKKEPERRKKLIENANFFRNALLDMGFNVRGCSQIIPLITGSNDETIKLSKLLLGKGYLVVPIRPPTVPVGEARLRFSLTCNHSRECLEKLIDALTKQCQS